MRALVLVAAVLLGSVCLCIGHGDHGGDHGHEHGHAHADVAHHRRRPGVENIPVESLTNVMLAGADASGVLKPGPTGSFAYVTVYSEAGWAVDSEEVLISIRVLLASLKPLKYPFIVLIPEGTSKRAKDTLIQEGASLVSVGQLGKEHVDHFGYNPFVLLHAWSLTQFERVIYLSKSSVVTHEKELNDLFLCGEFCAIWNNPCALSPSLMVLRPRVETFRALTISLHEEFSPAGVPEYFTPEQLFLSTFFAPGKTARLFSPSKYALARPSEEKYFRLHIYYALPAYYYVEKRNWALYKCGAFEEFDVPAATIWFGPPLPLVTYPAYWYSTMIQPFSWWLDIRAKLSEPDLVPTVLLRLVVGVVVLALVLPRVLARCMPALHPTPTPGAPLVHPLLARAADYLGPVKACGLISLICFLVCLKMSLLLIPDTVPPLAGWPLFILFYHLNLLAFGRVIAAFLVGPATAHAPRHAPASGAGVFTAASLKGSVVAWITFAFLPAIDNFVYGYVNWGVHWKVITTFSVMLFVAGSTFHVFFPIVTASPVFRSTLSRHGSEKSIAD